MKPRRILTIGHSTQPMDAFLGLLRKHSVTAIADVRSTPYSRYAPQYSRGDLETSLAEAGIAYVFLGSELGARSADDTCTVDGAVSYEKLARTPLFRKGIERVEEGSAGFDIALMCAERDPVDCHRTILVSRALSQRGFEISHILGDGEIEPHRDTMLRVLDILNMPREDMIHSQDELIEEAYRGRGRQIAWRGEGLGAR